ncbi:hypothetical protein [Spiroplasma endosymbiont of Glossina fuscipes fuscipes]|uniref:hypothetical protein n=2 Tax=unclassified Spiroplasma TaxID=2637901 RepID=UPI003C76B514
MKKLFKEINKLRLFFNCLSIIMCVLTTTFLILCREWINDGLGFVAYVMFCIFDIIFSLTLIWNISCSIWELIENKKEKQHK